jgi:anthranilate 1,2-dioxygenase small subunit
MDPLLTIARVQAEYARTIDEGELERWPDYFEERCLYRITTADNHKAGFEAAIVFANSRGMLIDRISALREANIYERHAYRHILGLPVILDVDADGTVARSETPFIVARIMRDGQTDLFVTGRYIDRYRLDGARASLVERIVVCDSSRIDTLLALPL